MNKIIIIMLLIFIASCSHQQGSVKSGKPIISADFSTPRNLVKTVHFYTDKDRVILEEIKYLDDNVEWLKNNIDEIVIIEGHCDERGSIAYNMDLGDRRARWIKFYLVKRGVNPKKIIVISYGESRPIDPGHNYRAWKKNRRVVFELAR